MKKKITAIFLCVALVAIAIVGASLAYFTDTKTATNTFTVGNVKIDLTEPSWNANDAHSLMPGATFEKDPTITVAQGSQDAYVFLEIDLNKYVSLINLAGVDAYKNGVGGLTGTYPGFGAFMQMLLDNNQLREAFVNRWFTGIDHSLWKIMNVDEIKAAVAATANGENPAHINIILGYQKSVLKAGQSVKFMTAFGMPDTITSSMFDGEDAYMVDGVSKSNFNTANSDFKMTFTAYAIQAAEINGLNAAYAALFK